MGARMAEQTKTVKNQLSRTISPYAFPTEVPDCLEETRLMAGGEQLGDGEMLTLESDALDVIPHVAVKLACSSITAIRDQWGLGVDDLSLAILVEAPFLNLLDVTLLDWPTLPDRGGTAAFTDYQLPEWVQQAAGRTKVGVSALLLLSREIKDPTSEWMPTHKGAILAEWSAAFGVPSLVHWFTPLPLNEAARERLNKRSTCSIAKETTLYVQCEGLLEQQPLEQALVVYLDEGLANIIHTATPTAAVKAIESQVVYQVLSEMLDSMRDDAMNSQELHPDSAGRPLLDLLAKEAGQSPEEIFELLKVRGSSPAILALRSHLQSLAGTTGAAISAIRKGDA